MLCQSRCYGKYQAIEIGIIELKSKTAHTNEIIEKLKYGSYLAIRILEKCNINPTSIKFYHIVLSQRWDTSEYKVLTNRKIEIHGKKWNIFPKRCGTSFLDVFSIFE